MLEDIFVTDNVISTPKTALDLSEMPEAWPVEIQNYVISSVPVLMEAPGDLSLDTVDMEKKYAKGSYVVDANGEKLVFPIIVKAGKLQPIDIFIYKGKWHPVDMDDIHAVLSSTQIGTGLMREEDVPIGADGSNMGISMAPGQYGTGMISNITRKMSSLNPKITDSIMTMIKGSKQVLKKLASDAGMKNIFVRALETPPETEKTASATNPFVGTDSVVLSLGQGVFSVKYASKGSDTIHTMQVKSNELATFLKEADADYERMLNELVSDKIATSWNDERAASEKLASANDSFYYRTYTRDGLKPVDSFVLGMSKTAGKREYIAVNSNGTYTKQEAILGEKLAFSTEFDIDPPIKMASAMAGDTLIIPIPDTESSSSDPMTVMDPLRVESVVSQPGMKVASCRDSSGKNVKLLITADDVMPVKAAHVENAMVNLNIGDNWYVGENYPVFKLAGKAQELVKTAADMATASMLLRAIGKNVPVVKTAKLWKVGTNSNAIKVGSADPRIISDAEAMLYIRKADGGNAMESMAKIASGIVKTINVISSPSADRFAEGPSDTRLLSDGKQSKNIKGSIWDPKTNRSRTDPMFKGDEKMAAFIRVAASLENEEDVDTVLSLNYVTPENMVEFKNSVPDMRKTEDTLAKLLISARLGNKVVDENDVKSALNALHSIIKEVDGAM